MKNAEPRMIERSLLLPVSGEDRTWNSRKMGISDDDRDLGVEVAVLEN